MTGSPYVLAIDQGTTSTRAILFDAQGQVRQAAQIELTQYYPQPGWVEHDPEEIWQSVVSTCREAAAAADGPIAAIGIANQRETTVLWDRATGRPVHNAIVWQDRRTADLCARWRREGLARNRRAAHRARHRSLFLRFEDPLAARRRAGPAPARRGRRDRLWHDRQLSVVAADRRPAPRDRRDQCRAHDAVRHRPFRVGRRASRRIPDPARDPARGARYRRRFRHCLARIVRRRDPDRGAGRRPAGGADRPGLLQARHDQIDLRHRRFCAAQHRQRTGRLAPSAADDDRLSARRPDRLCARRQHLCRRSRGAMAARPARDHRDRGRSDDPCRARRPAPAPLSGAGFCRARRALLGAAGARLR